MTSKEIHRKSVIEQYESTVDGAIDMAVARAGSSANALLNYAFAASEMTQRQLASMLKVTVGRVSQIMDSDETIKVATLARYLRAMGYSLTLDAIPSSASIKPLSKPTNRRRRSRNVNPHEVFAQAATKNDETAVAITILPSGFDHIDFQDAPVRVASGARVDIAVHNNTSGRAPTEQGFPQKLTEVTT